MLYLIGIGFLASVLLAPVTSLSIHDPQGRQLVRTNLGEGSRVIICHLNSMYDARVEEHLELRDGLLELAEVKTTSYAIHEYYRTTEGTPQRRFGSLVIRNSAGRDFTLEVDGQKLSVLEEHRNIPLYLKIEHYSLGSRLRKQMTKRR